MARRGAPQDSRNYVQHLELRKNCPDFARVGKKPLKFLVDRTNQAVSGDSAIGRRSHQLFLACQ